jgi:ribonuclease P/MRP protein subunit RPP1
MLNRVRKTFEVVSVVCSSKLVARQAAKDRRVDLLSFDHSTRCRFDRAEAELASGTNTSLEIDLTILLASWERYLARLLNELRTEVSIAHKYEIPVILSSGASNIWMLRSPHDWASVASLFDLDEEEAMRALSDTPNGLVYRNRAKLSPDFLLPGVNIVGET